MHTPYKSVTVLMTVKNEPDGCAATLRSLDYQTHAPDEIVIVDGGSTDDTVQVIRSFAAFNPRIKLIEAPGANIACGRNIGTRAATCEIIATTDSGCRAEPQWLEKLMQPFEENPDTEFVAGFYRVETNSLLEKVVGLATMRGQINRSGFPPLNDVETAILADLKRQIEADGARMIIGTAPTMDVFQQTRDPVAAMRPHLDSYREISDPIDITPDYWESKRRELVARHSKKKS